MLALMMDIQAPHEVLSGTLYLCLCSPRLWGLVWIVICDCVVELRVRLWCVLSVCVINVCVYV